MDGVVQGAQAGPPPAEPLDALFGGRYMQRVPDEELTGLITNAAEQGLDRHTDDVAAAAVYLTLLGFMPSRPPEFWTLFEELYPAVRSSGHGLQLLGRLDDTLELTSATSWEYESGGKKRKSFVVTNDLDLIPELVERTPAPHGLNATHESVENNFDVRFHGMLWTLTKRVPTSHLVKDHILVGFLVAM